MGVCERERMGTNACLLVRVNPYKLASLYLSFMFVFVGCVSLSVCVCMCEREREVDLGLSFQHLSFWRASRQPGGNGL